MLLNWTGVPRLVWRLVQDRRVPIGLKLILAVAAVYVVMPFDADMIPVIGRIDDVLVVVLALGLFLGLAPRDVVVEHIRSNGKPDAAAEDKGPVIEGQYRRVEDADSEDPKTTDGEGVDGTHPKRNA